MQQACFSSGRPIVWIACIIFIALASVALLGVVTRGGFSSLLLPTMTDMFGICPNCFFRNCYPFVYLLRNFHVFENVACSIVGLHLKIPALYIGVFFPAVWGGMKENLFEIFGGHILGDTRSRKKR